MLANNSSHAAPQPWPSISPSLGITDKGIVCGEGVILAHRTKGGGGGSRMAPEADEDRLVALLSVMSGRPVAPADVLHHVEAASAHWRRGEKALANFRLVFSGLPRPDTPAATDRLRVAADLLDDGLSPATLMKALWPEQADPLGKYAPDQPRVPAGNGARSGEWEFWGGGASISGHDGGIVVASGDKPDVTDGRYITDEFEGRMSFEEAFAHRRHWDPLSEIPLAPPFESETAAQLSAAAKSAVEAIGAGRGPVYGTKVHTDFKIRIDALERPDIHTEQSYKSGELVKWGSPGSVRVDVIQGPKKEPLAVFDLKTGSASLTKSRIENLRQHLPRGADIDIHEVRP